MHPLGTVSPAREEFLMLARTRRVVPVTIRLLADGHTPLSIYRATALDESGTGRPGTFLMESAAPGAAWSRHSFIGVASRATLTEHVSERGRAHWLGDPPAGTPAAGSTAEVLRDTLEFLSGGQQSASPAADGPSQHLTSGLVGYIGWEAVRHWERLPHPPADDLQVPEMAMNLVSDLIVHDNRDGTVTLVANAINADGRDTGAEIAYEDALARLASMRRALVRPVDSGVTALHPDSAQEVELDLQDRVEHSWDEGGYLATLGKAKDAIVDGEVFQIVVSRRFEVATGADALSVYRMLRLLNPSPYMYLFHFEAPPAPGEERGRPYQLVGASPEALVTVDVGEDGQRTAVSHPIAGTRPRGKTPSDDAELAEDLLADQKERAEHIMLVDLARNDLAKVSVPGSVEVTRFMTVEHFSHVMHMTSHVQGRVARESSAYDVLAATFPAGTLSGAPKPRALQLLDEWEPTRRGIYGGVVGYFDLSGRMDAAIAIRSALLQGGRAYVQAGGGIVADSEDDAERQETVNKAAAPLRAVLSAERLTSGLS